MSVLIKGMPLPTDKHHAVAIFLTSSEALANEQSYEAVELPPHGDLIDRDKIILLFAD